MKSAVHPAVMGALAIAMGISAAVSTSAPGIASADPSDPPGRGSATSSDSAPDAPASHAETSHRGGQRHRTPAQPAHRRESPDRELPDVTAPVQIARPAAAAEPPRRGVIPEVDIAEVVIPQAANPEPPAPVAITQPRPVATVPLVSADTAPTAITVIADHPAALQLPTPQIMRTAPQAAAARALGSLFGSTPGGTAESPIGWVVLAAVRRQGIGPRTRVAVPAATTTVVNTPPVIAKVVLSEQNSATGAVTGTVTASDPNGDRITYKATTSTRGTVSITTAGVFTYTPTATARHAAARLGATTAATTDTVTVTVTDSKGAATSRAVTVPILPRNSAPTATLTVGAPNPATGVVTGAVTGSDADKDPLTYTASTPANGAVSITANGSFAYTPTAAARTRAATSPKAMTDTFTVTVADGYGGTTAVNVTAGIAPAAQPGALSTFCGCTLMPANTVFHADVSSRPVLAKSATWTALLGGNLFAAWGGNPWMGNTAGMPVNVVSATRPGEKVIFNRGYTTSGPSIDPGLYAIPDYPIVEGMPSAPAWDRHLLVFQEGTCISQELYNVANGVELPASDLGDALANSIYAGAYGSTWIAEAGVRYNMNSPLYPAIGWANASQLPYLPLILRPDDLARGSIDHMLGITIAKDRGTGYTWPARAGDGTGTNPNGVPMGTVFRLRADFDIAKYDPNTQVILRALKKHGAVVYDSGNPGQNGATLLAQSNGWTGTGYLTAQQQLRTIPLSAFEAVDVLSLAADPAVGWAIRSTV